MIFIDYDLNKIKEEVKNPNTILLDYDNSKIEIAKNLSVELEKEEFYKAYIFDEDTMYTCVNFGDEIKMSKISKNDFDKYQSRNLYLKQTKRQTKFSQIKVNIGFIKEDNKERIEVFQYAGLE